MEDNSENKKNTVVLRSSHLPMLFIISIYGKLAKDLKNLFEVVPCSRPATSLKVNSFNVFVKDFAKITKRIFDEHLLLFR